MTKEEKTAFEFGKTFLSEFGKTFSSNLVDDKIAPCYDDRMKSLDSETRTENGSKRNIRNMRAWWNGLMESNPNIRIEFQGDELLNG